ncbi:hypothetical protein [Halioxenophilus aromaticivorans]|uniref:Uncharacterized protein n=1 Tax=Halioxenophilus aromaticivorans TaxID=1306992 RepID=A0AAV3U5L7_9ALTE
MIKKISLTTAGAAIIANALTANPVVAEEIILNGDGTQIRLNDDGSWERVSDDIYLDTAEGRRVVLKADGRWSYVGLAPVVKDDQYRELMVEVAISGALIKETREKVGSGKNFRTESQTVYDLTVSVAATASQPLQLSDLKTDYFSVADQRGKQFKVLALNHNQQNIQPGETAQLQLVCKDAPSAFARSKTLTVTIDSQAFATEQPVSLDISYDVIKRQRINL